MKCPVGQHPVDEKASPEEAAPIEPKQNSSRSMLSGQPLRSTAEGSDLYEPFMVAEPRSTPRGNADAVPGEVEAHDPPEMMGGDANNHKKQKVSPDGGTVLERLDIIEKSLGDSAAVSTMNQKLDLLTLLVQQLVGRSQQSLAPRRSDVTSVVSGTEPETMEEAADSKVWISGRLVKWFPEKAFGFLSSKGVDVFGALHSYPWGSLRDPWTSRDVPSDHRSAPR